MWYCTETLASAEFPLAGCLKTAPLLFWYLGAISSGFHNLFASWAIASRQLRF
jgi:hypothetical protein